MRIGRLRVALAAIAVLAAAAIPLLAGSARTPQAGRSLGHDEFPPALSAHLAELAKAIPGNGGEPADGPTSGEEAKLQELAYPSTDIALSWLNASSAAFTAAKSRDFTRGKGRPSGWVSVGPSTAVYPFFAGRDLSLYVPNEYVAASRINAVAIAPSCRPGSCRMWIGPAGGGIWRTNNALADTPSWSYLSGSFAINAIGSITIDPTDPSGNTIWVGTGEANTCGSGCVHGHGIYKSTDGGDTWTGPYGESVFGGRGVGSIAIDPANANHAWISYSGYNFNTPSQPGHVFSVTYNPTTGDATWTSLDGGTTAFPDLPATDVVFDSVTGDLYASTDFGVLRRASGSGTWAVAGAGLPAVEVAGLTIAPGARLLYAATHGRSAWRLNLP
jgi:hypothetical protein